MSKTMIILSMAARSRCPWGGSSPLQGQAPTGLDIPEDVVWGKRGRIDRVILVHQEMIAH
jgi:hypothetical protein